VKFSDAQEKLNCLFIETGGIGCVCLFVCKLFCCVCESTGYFESWLHCAAVFNIHIYISVSVSGTCHCDLC